jgi:hypothetical protein
VVEGNFIGTTPDGLASGKQLGPTGIELAPGASAHARARGPDQRPRGQRRLKHYQGQVFGVGLLLNAPGLRQRDPGQPHRHRMPAAAHALPNMCGHVRDTGFVSGRPADEHLLGGTAGGTGHTIAFNLLEGVKLMGATEGVRISGNSIHSNGADGIDLVPLGPTPTDPATWTRGPNGLQNKPVLLGVKPARARDVCCRGAARHAAGRGLQHRVLRQPRGGLQRLRRGSRLPSAP